MNSDDDTCITLHFLQFSVHSFHSSINVRTTIYIITWWHGMALPFHRYEIAIGQMQAQCNGSNGSNGSSIHTTKHLLGSLIQFVSMRFLLQLTEWMIEWVNERARDWITKEYVLRMSVFSHCLTATYTETNWKASSCTAVVIQWMAYMLAHTPHIHCKGVILIRYQREVIGVWMRVELCVLFVRVYYINETAATAAEYWKAEQRNGETMQWWWETNLCAELCIECVWK